MQQAVQAARFGHFDNPRHLTTGEMNGKKQEPNATPTAELEKEGATRDAAIAFLENRGAVVKSKSPTHATLVKAGLKANLSPAEATAQLRVLCRKFAALTEKVKEETKVRETAEREVRRLKALLDGDSAPAIATCRAETQAYVRELKETQEKLKRELRLEKEKNERIVEKALELEREKSTLLAAQSQQQQAQDHSRNPPPPQEPSAWDKEQVQKIQETLKLTIEELEDELSRKDEEMQTYRERSQRDRARVKALEDELQSKADTERAAQQTRRQLEADLRQAQTEITNEIENMQRIHDQAQEDRAIRETLEQQLVTLGEVNAALEQRSRALVRRLELASAVSQECQDLKQQLRDAEEDNENLVQTIRDLKEEQFVQDKDWKVRLESVKEEKNQVEQQVHELQEDLASLQAQNSLFSEWMLVRNENALAAQRGIPQPQDYQEPEQTKADVTSSKPRSNNSWHRDVFDGDSSSNNYLAGDACHDGPSRIHPAIADLRRCEPASLRRSVSDQYGEQRRSRTQTGALGSPNSDRQTSRRWPAASPRSSSLREAARPRTSEKGRSPRRKMSTASVSSCSSVTSGAPSSAPSSSSSTDHERLRKLMSRNRELQQRLQQETVATQNLEREITSMTS